MMEEKANVLSVWFVDRNECAKVPGQSELSRKRIARNEFSRNEARGK